MFSASSSENEYVKKSDKQGLTYLNSYSSLLKHI